MTHSQNSFPHQRLDAYRIAISLFRGVEEAAAAFPRGYGDMKDQLRRAAGAVARNLAEGANREHSADKTARFVIARGELGECEATLEMAQIAGAIDPVEAVRLRRLAGRAGALVGGLIRCQRKLE